MPVGEQWESMEKALDPESENRGQTLALSLAHMTSSKSLNPSTIVIIHL